MWCRFVRLWLIFSVALLATLSEGVNAGNDGECNVIGKVKYHTIRARETMFDIAEKYDLGVNDLELLYPHLDRWLLPAGYVIMIPTSWILPESRNHGERIVINIPEIRMYHFTEDGNVETFPLGIGTEGWETPLGTYRIISKRENPTWYIPPSLREKYGGRTSIPPGPDNPLGKFIMKFADSYGIHGTNKPVGIGLLVSHGCIRMYPKDIEHLYPRVKIGTPVKIIYQPVKFGYCHGRVYVEVHPDIYGRIDDMWEYTTNLLNRQPFRDIVDIERLMEAVGNEHGIPVDVTK